MTWPRGQGEMATRVRGFDWSQTPLGSVDTWSGRLRAVVDLVLASPLVSTLAVGAERTLIYNDVAARLYGARHPEALGRSLARTFPDSFPEVAALYDQVFAGEAVQVQRQPLAVGNLGADEIFDAYLTPVEDETGAVIGAQMVGIEVGARVRAEQALRDSEARYRAFVTASSDVVYRMSPDWSEMRQLQGRAFLSDTDQPSDAWLNSYINPEDQPAVNAAIQRAIRTQSTFELEHRVICADGSLGWTLSRAVPIIGDAGEIREWLGAASDITAAKHAEAALRAREKRQRFLTMLGDEMRASSSEDAIIAVATQRLGELLDASRIVYAEIDDAAGLAWVRKAWTAEGIEQHPPALKLADFGGPLLADLRAGHPVLYEDAGTPPYQRPDLAALAATGIKAGLSIPLIVYGRLIANLNALQDQSRAWTDEDIALTREVAERTWAAVERARAKRNLHESEQKYHAVFTSIDEGLCIIDVLRDANGDAIDYRFLEVNPAFERQTGLKEVVGKRASDVAPGTEAHWIEALGEVASTGEPRRIENYHEQTGRWYDAHASRLDSAHGPVVSIVFNDITDRKLGEDTLRASEARQAFLLDLSDALRAESTASDIGAAATQLIARRLDANRCCIAQLSPQADRAWIEHEYKLPALPSIVGECRFQDLPEAVLRLQQQSLLCADVEADPALTVTDKQAMLALNMAAVIAVPLRRGRDGDIWVMTVATTDPRRWSRNDLQLLEDTAERVWAALDRAHTEVALRDSEERLQTLMAGVPQLVWRAVNGGYWTWASPQWSDYTGQAEADSHGFGWLAPIHPADREQARTMWSDAMDRGEFHADYRIFHAAEGRYRWFQTRAAAVRDGNGKIVEWLGTSTDVHDLRELQQRQQILVAELQHRVRNILTVVRSVFGRTAETSDDLEDAADHFKGRLDSLARTQVIQTQSASGLVDLESLIREELLSVGVSDGPGVVIDGPDVLLPPATAESIGLAIHELTINAVKYGALKNSSTTLDIRWSADLDYGENRKLNLTWTEQGVPAISVKPIRRGFGTDLITEALPYQLGAETSLEFRGGGVRCSLSVPLPEEDA